MPISSIPKTRRGRSRASIHLPKTKLPNASPAMKALSTVLTAREVVPNTTPSMRAHTTW